ARVDGQAPAELGGAVLQQFGRVPTRAQPELLVGEELAGGVGVLALRDVEVGGAEAGRVVGGGGGEGGGSRDVVVHEPGHRRGLAEDVARQVGPQHGRLDRHPPAPTGAAAFCPPQHEGGG